MSEHDIPDEYTQTRAEFGHRAITTLRATRDLLEDLTHGYRTFNGHTQPTSGGNTGDSGGLSQGSSPNVAAAASNPHHPYLLVEAIQALNKLIEFTETVYL